MGLLWTICSHLGQWATVRKIKINLHTGLMVILLFVMPMILSKMLDVTFDHLHELRVKPDACD